MDLFIPTLVIPTQPAQFNFTSKPCTPLHLLHEILGVVININKNCYIQISLGCMQNILVNLGVSLSNMGMVSESIAWEHFKIRMLRHLDSSAAMTLPDMAYAFMGLSVAYHWQHQFQSSIQASQQSLDLWHHLSDSLPDVDIRICLIMVLTTQTRSLLKTSEKMAALSIAQDAVALSRPMLQQMIKPSSGSSSSVDNFNADWSCAAIFELAKALSSLNHHLKSYEALKEDVIRAFHCHPLHSNDPLILNIFITHFDETIAILREVVEKSDSNIFTDEWILWTVARIIQFLPTPNQLALLQVLVRTIEHFGAILANRGSDWQWVLDDLFNPIYHNLWRTGLLDGALKVCGQAIRYLDSCFKSDEVTVAAGYWRLNRHFILCDMGRYSDAIGLLQQATIASVPEGFLLHPYIVQIRILHRTGRNQEALQLLRKGVAAGCQKCWTDSVEVFQLQLIFCLQNLQPPGDIHTWKKRRGLMAAEEAVSIYTENVPHMWGDFLYTIRKQELGANVFHALSCDCHRRLRGSSGIMRKVSSPETYFCPALAEALEQLAGYLGRKAMSGEHLPQRLSVHRFGESSQLYPPEPEFLFEKVVDMVELEDKWEIPAPGRVSEADDEYHDASEGPSVEAVESDDEADKYHDASEPPTSIEPLALISELSSRSSTSTPGPAIDIDTPVQANPAGDPATAILGGSSTPAVQNPTSTDTAKSILSKPLELDVRLRLRSTLMDVVWWVLLGILFAIAAIAWRCLSINGPESRQEKHNIDLKQRVKGEERNPGSFKPRLLRGHRVAAPTACEVMAFEMRCHSSRATRAISVKSTPSKPPKRKSK
ncbi:hypothetical protein B0H14DRAFT_3779128 [Mycena olivaceomarginata]|nr:hypothetical protein B0H14DRAFT_3779128 [Mycena olivaceomarginata]